MSNLYLNGTEVHDLFKARLLGYTVDPHSIGSPHYEAAASIVPVKVVETIGVRPITLELEFEGDSIEDTVRCISNATAAFLKWCDFKMPDGFWYKCLFDSAGSPVFKGGTYATCKFKFVGYRHLEQRTGVFLKSGEMAVIGNHEAPAIITIENCTGDITVNGIAVSNVKNTVVIDGYAKTVKEYDPETDSWVNIFARCTLTRFPSLIPGPNTITIEGDAVVSFSYTPIFL